MLNCLTPSLDGSTTALRNMSYKDESKSLLEWMESSGEAAAVPCRGDKLRASCEECADKGLDAVQLCKITLDPDSGSARRGLGRLSLGGRKSMDGTP